MQRILHETCQQYAARRISEGWAIVYKKGYHLMLSPPDGSFLRFIDLRNDVETLRPNAAGDETNLTCYPNPNFQQVDEEIADDDVTYVHTQATGAWQRDLYNLPAGSGGGTINSVILYFRVCSSDSSERQKGVIKSNSTVTETVQKNVYTEYGNNVWHTYSKEWATNPAGGNWTWAAINALQIGINMYSAAGGCPVTSCCTQVYVEINYTSEEIKQLSESFSISDSLTKSAIRQLPEVLSIVDSKVIKVSKALAEIFSIVDTWTARLILSESFTIKDLTVFMIDSVRFKILFNEAVQVVDSINTMGEKAFSETLGLVDSVTKAAIRKFGEIIKIVDSLIRRIFTIIRKISIRIRGGSYESDIELED
ncbi:hypothetical protein ES705_43147 [subsurface metagenome]